MDDEEESDPEDQRIPTAWWVIGLGASGLFCTALLTPMLGLPVRDPLAAVGLALLVAVLAVRALGQTDLNPVSGVGKLSQVLCSHTNTTHGHKSSRSLNIGALCQPDLTFVSGVGKLLQMCC